MRVHAEDKSAVNHSVLGNVLIVGDELPANSGLITQLSKLGFHVLVSNSGIQSIALLEENNIDLVLLYMQLPDISCSELIRHIKAYSTDIYIPIVLLASASDEELLLNCMEAGGDDILLEGFSPAVLNVRINAMMQLRELKQLYRNSIHEQVVGKQILSAALSTRSIEVTGMQVLSYSAAIFSGDLVLSARNARGGLHILLADFTGHGLSAAIGVLPVAEMFSVMTEKGFDPEAILENINNKLYTLLPTGMFMAACMLDIDNESGAARVWNSGMPDVYLLDNQSNGIKRRIRSAHIPLGINEKIDYRFEPERFDIQSGDQFIMHSDGLIDAIDTAGIMFGASRLEHLIEDSGTQESVFTTIASAFNRFCSNQELSDDVTLVVIPCIDAGKRSCLRNTAANDKLLNTYTKGWRFMIELSGPSLYTVNPIPIVIDQYLKLGDLVVDSAKLENILTALYENSLNHGVLELSHVNGMLDDNETSNVKHRNTIEKLHYGFVRIELQQIKYQGNASLLVRLEDSGRGFDHVSLLTDISEQSKYAAHICKTGIPMVRDLCQSLNYHGSGSRVEAIVGDYQHEGTRP